MATYSDQFYIIDPANPPDKHTPLTVHRFDMLDADNNGYINSDTSDRVDGQQVESVWNGDQIEIRIGKEKVTVTGVTFYLDDGRAVFTPTDGTILQDATFHKAPHYETESTQAPVGSFGPPCFAAGTLLETPAGPRPIEALTVGDLVMTVDDGPQPIRWIGSRAVEGAGRHAPILFEAGSMGNTRPLRVSPQHRMLLSGWRAELLFGAGEVLVPAKHLVNGTTIRIAPCPQVTYLHLLFDRHQILLAEGAPSESLHPGDFLLSEDEALRDELRDLFPEAPATFDPAPPTTARYVLKRHEVAVLAQAA